MNPNLWRSGDAEWLKQRKQGWKELEPSLKETCFITNKDMKHLCSFSLYGKQPENYALQDAGKVRISDYPLPIFYQIWLTPTNDVKYLRSLFLDPEAEDLERKYSERSFIEYATDGTAYNTSYGMMGGREEIFVKVIYGEGIEDYLGSYFADNTRISGKFMPEISIWFANKGLPLYNPYQWMVNHWYEGLKARSTESLSRQLTSPGTINFLHQMAASELPELAFPEERKRYQSFKDKVVGILESGDLPDVVTEAWDKVKAGKLRWDSKQGLIEE